MNWCDETLGFGSTPAPTDEEVEARLKALSPEELVRAWREAATTSLRDRTDGTYAVHMYFDRLGHDEPERAVAFLEALLANEPDDALVALTAQGKLLGQLLHFFNGRRVAHSLQQLALRQKRLRWLIGAVTWSISDGMVENGDAKRRLLPIADKEAFEAWEETYQGRETPDSAVLPIAELAALRVEIMSRSDLDKEKDEHWSELFDFQSELVNNETRSRRSSWSRPSSRSRRTRTCWGCSPRVCSKT